ncbi:AAA family ATPase, partial [bacterium]|nr:AAA family ATPase [bacterium]
KEINDVAPTSLSHVACESNRTVIEQCRVAIDAAFEDDRRLDDILLTGPPGVGKSSLSFVLAQEMAVPFHEVLGQNLRTPADLNNLLLSCESKAICLIDEIHEAPPAIQTAMFMALDKRQIMVRAGSSVQALPIADFTLIAATTEPYQILEPLRQRAKLHLELSFFTESDLMVVVERRCRGLSWDIEPAVLPEIAKRARGVPRLALRLTASARRVSRADGRSLITLADLHRALELEQLDSLGLGPLESKYLKLLAEGPRRVNVLASALGVPAKTLTTVTEPFLIRAGLLDKDSTSKRVLTRKGKEHLARNDAETVRPPPSENS